jgi:glycosyltransferase involved in cell wall biosynthesis
MTAKLPISVVVLTYNEEKNIEDCLRSVHGWVEDIFVVDSYSTDKTLEIGRKYTEKIYQNPFEDYSKQRNWALENLPITTEWILNVDADHRVTAELKNELLEIFSKDIVSEIKGFLASRRIIFMDRWIKHGGLYPTYHAVLFRKGHGICEDRLYDQHFIVNGSVETLKGDVIDIVADSLQKFIQSHNRWATMEAFEQLLGSASAEQIKPDISGNSIEKRRFLRQFYNRFPLFVRPFLYFIYRYFFRLGFLDGREGLVFHFLQGFWYRFLVDAKIYEIKKKARTENRDVRDVVRELYGIV